MVRISTSRFHMSTDGHSRQIVLRAVFEEMIIPRRSLPQGREISFRARESEHMVGAKTVSELLF